MATTLGKFGVSFEIAYASRLVDGQHQENLILLDLDEVNRLIPTVFDKVGTSFRRMPDHMAIEDLKTAELYTPSWDTQGQLLKTSVVELRTLPKPTAREQAPRPSEP